MGLHRNRARMTVSGTPGTGNVTLGAALAAYQSFAAAGVVDTDQIRVCFEDGTAWEISDCIYTAAGTSLARTLEESSTGSLISLSSAAICYIEATNRDVHQVGEVVWYMGHTVPPGMLEAFGQNISRSTYRGWFNAAFKSSTVTITIASPGVITWGSPHGFKQGDPVKFVTSGALPTGIVGGTVYYVSANGLTSTDFRITATIGGADINTSGTQSGTQTGRHAPFGFGDDSTTIGFPDLRSNTLVGRDNAGGTAANVLTGQAGGVQGLLPGGEGGEAAHTPTLSELFPHAHTFQGATANPRLNLAGQAAVGSGTINIAQGSMDNAGSGTAHNLVQPTMVVPRPCIWVGV